MKEKRKKKLGFMYYLMILIAICLVGYIGYEYLNKKDNKTTNKDNNKNNVVETKKLNIIDLKSNSRPYAVMVNNLDVARKYQSGLQDAYIVYEIVVESGITRMMAVFKDKDTARIGSVRSSRNYYLDYALENDAIYVHYGWSPQAESDMKTLGVNNINGLYDNAFTRENLPVAFEHTAFTSMKQLKSTAKNKGYRLTSTKKPVLNYSVDEINLDKETNAVIANSVSIKYSTGTTTSYKYTTDKLYYRSVNGYNHYDYVTKKQYTTKNIIIAYVDNGYISNDDKGRQELDNIGTGNGFYITNGYSIPITWKKESRAAQTVYKKISGEEITVNDGNTFIQIAPLNSSTIS